MNASSITDRGRSVFDLEYIRLESIEQRTILFRSNAWREAQDHIRRLRENPRSFLGLIDSDISRESWEKTFWEELSITCATDLRTFTHALGVAHILHWMWTGHGETAAYLAQTLGDQREDVSPGVLFAAALLHDIGKRLIIDVVHDKRTKREWALLANKTSGDELFAEEFIRPVEEGGLPDPALDIYLHAIEDPINIVPIEQAFPETALATLSRRGIPSSLTFREVIELHEAGTGLLLEAYPDMGQVAEIAAWHHPSRTKTIDSERYPIATSALRIAVMQCLYLADTFEALMSGFRTYKGRFDLCDALGIIVQETERHAIDPALTRAFVTDQLHHDRSANRPINLLVAGCSH